MQKLVEAKVDGVLGPGTAGQAKNSPDHKRLAFLLCAERSKFVIRICKRDASQFRFIDGWQNRIFRVVDFVAKM